MHVTVIGVQPVNFTGSDGRQVTGHNLYVTYPSDRVEGVVSMKVFIPSRIVFVPNVGDEIDIIYNRYGKVHDIVCP